MRQHTNLWWGVKRHRALRSLGEYRPLADGPQSQAAAKSQACMKRTSGNNTEICTLPASERRARRAQGARRRPCRAETAFRTRPGSRSDEYPLGQSRKTGCPCQSQHVGKAAQRKTSGTVAQPMVSHRDGRSRRAHASRPLPIQAVSGCTVQRPWCAVESGHAYGQRLQPAVCMHMQ
jgi:hypothetical protein